MDFPIEYRERMLAEQMMMMEALQFVAQILIYSVILLAFVILIVNLSDVIWTRLNERRLSEGRQPQSRAALRRGSAIP
jgi:flagellar biosynthesis protein FlhB